VIIKKNEEEERLKKETKEKQISLIFLCHIHTSLVNETVNKRD